LNSDVADYRRQPQLTSFPQLLEAQDFLTRILRDRQGAASGRDLAVEYLQTFEWSIVVQTNPNLTIHTSDGPHGNHPLGSTNLGW
jgi:hypothetical protein